MRKTVLALALALATAHAPGADAAGGRFTWTTARVPVSLGGGSIVVAVCEVSARSDQIDIALSTFVRCGMNGVFDQRSMPGSESAAVVVNVTEPGQPVTMCWAASAVFYDTAQQRTYSASYDEVCLTA